MVNPFASTVTPKRRRLAIDSLTSGHDLTVVETTARDHATTLAAEAEAAGRRWWSSSAATAP